MTKHNDASQYQLPKHIVPSHYDIVQRPNFATFRFTGSVTIDLDINEPSSEIKLHSRELKITDAYVVNENGTRLNAIKSEAEVTFLNPDEKGEPEKHKFLCAATLNQEEQTATFKFAGVLGKGKWKLYAEYEGSTVQPDLEGFYRSPYEDATGKDCWILSTQFEATHARRAFPCFDEPALKATADITVVTDKNLVALSNMRAVSVTEENGEKVVKFATTPKQSTYLFAWAVGDLESSEAVWSNGVEIRVWSIPGKNHMKTLALRAGAYGVKWLESKLGVKYFGGDKIDLLAIPKYRSGAMENTGLITFNPTSLLVDLNKATIAEIQRVAEVVFHELVHQWFGNLVTMLWWDGLPLNESNATILAYIIMDDYEPEWHIFDSFGASRASAFALDSLKSTHPCYAPVGHPDEVEERFDQITYEKGGSLEFQLKHFIGPDAFYHGMNVYLTRYNHGNAEVTDLWDALEEGSKLKGVDVPVRSLMDNWFLQDGHPVVTVSPSDKPGFVKLQQERFSFLADSSFAEQLWQIPLHLRYATADGSVREEKFIFAGREQEVFLDAGFKWVVANAGGSGFYRVRYGQELLDKLLEKPLETLKVIERYNLVNDSWALVRAQKLGCDTFINVVKKFAGEDNANVWSIVSGSLAALHGFTAGEDRAAFKQLVRDLVKPVFEKLGWTPKDNETSATLELRGTMAGLLGTIGEDKEVQTKAAELFEAWKKDSASVDANVVPALVSIAAYTGDKARFDEFLGFAKSAPTDQEKLRFQGALGKFRTKELYEAAINFVMTEVKEDDAPRILSNFLGLELAGEATWNAVCKNWDAISKRFPANGIVSMVRGCSALDTPKLKAEVEAFFATHKVKQGDMAMAQMLERLSINARLRAAETPRLSAYLTASAKKADGAPGSAA